MTDYLWWRDGVIYQIYPRSFTDSNGDGQGDLPGITSRLDYLAELGIDAIWLSPVYPSPDKDFGYDVSDYTAIDARFGNLADFDWLVMEAHQRGIHIIMDMVMNHTSDQHAWFKESCSSQENPKRDWYIWKDPRAHLHFTPFSSSKKGGQSGVPNNWQASFGGNAWEYDDATGQYYLHLFTKEQPDVNWRNPDVRKAQLDAFRFWMNRGVDGFRLDVFNAYFKHPDFPDNPPKFGLRNFDRQHHIYDMDQPEMMPLLNELRLLLDSFPERYSVGETYLVTPQKAVSYCGPDKLHAAFSFDFTSKDLSYPWNPRWIMEQVTKRELTFNAAGVWPTTVMSNHDLPRAASRYTKGEDDDQAKIAITLLLTLRGTPFMYYGEEIGMRDIRLPRHEILDPAGKKYWPIYKGRDGCRSPMQWNDSIYAGFSVAKPWLPVHPNYTTRNVAAQSTDPDSLLNFTKKLLAFRKEFPAMRCGDFVALKAHRGMLAFLRRTEEQFILAAVNFNSYDTKFTLPDGHWHEFFSNINKVPDAYSPLAPHEVRLYMKEK